MNFNIPSRMELPIKDRELDEYYGKDDNDELIGDDLIEDDEGSYNYE